MERLEEELKRLTLRLWEVEKQLREMREQNREIERSADFIKSILGE